MLLFSGNMEKYTFSKMKNIIVSMIFNSLHKKMPFRIQEAQEFGGLDVKIRSQPLHTNHSNIMMFNKTT